MPVEKRIQVIPDERIESWWNNNKGDKKRQDKMREAILIGLDVLEGKKGIVDPSKQEIYDAIAILIKNGIVPSVNTEQLAEKKEEPSKIKADPALIRRKRQSAHESIR